MERENKLQLQKWALLIAGIIGMGLIVLGIILICTGSLFGTGTGEEVVSLYTIRF